MSKWLHINKARKSQIYVSIVDAAVLRLEAYGWFSNADVLEMAGWGVLEPESIRWDIVRSLIEEEHDTQLVPLADAFFKSHEKEDEILFPERFLARGHGKCTVGFAIVSKENGHFVIRHLQYKRASANGASEGANKTLEIAKRSQIEGLPETPLTTSSCIAKQEPDMKDSHFKHFKIRARTSNEGAAS